MVLEKMLTITICSDRTKLTCPVCSKELFTVPTRIIANENYVVYGDQECHVYVVVLPGEKWYLDREPGGFITWAH